ncbi:cell division protein PerM, partial [Kitasatospora sp. LaBMicrA B282]|uniref:cell division protein PerM n=1 Tax=Kitasatospora sp. LaBMicrA B282 TaxID=3420949 RepID=UPI003D10036A
MTHPLIGRPLPHGIGALAAGPARAGALAALLGLAAVGAPVLLLWVLTAAPQDSAADAARLAGALWLLGHGGPLSRGAAAAPLALTPLLLTLCSVLLLRRAAARAAAQPAARPAAV